MRSALAGPSVIIEFPVQAVLRADRVMQLQGSQLRLARRQDGSGGGDRRGGPVNRVGRQGSRFGAVVLCIEYIWPAARQLVLLQTWVHPPRIYGRMLLEHHFHLSPGKLPSAHTSPGAAKSTKGLSGGVSQGTVLGFGDGFGNLLRGAVAKS